MPIPPYRLFISRKRSTWSVLGLCIVAGVALLLYRFDVIKPGQRSPTPTPKAERYEFRVIRQWPHSVDAFTQGLVFHEGRLLEGTGKHGASRVLTINLQNNTSTTRIHLPDPFFGEGITVLDGRIYQLTWRARTGFIYDAETFERGSTFTIETEGWGLTHDGRRLIMSDGTSIVRFLDPRSLAVVKKIQVRDADGVVQGLNELEYVDGKIYANLWPSDYAVRIDAHTGRVDGYLDLAPLRSRLSNSADTGPANGIAFNPESARLIVTGKYWSHLFEIEVSPGKSR